MTGTTQSEQAAFTLKATHDRSRAMTWDHDSNGKKGEQDHAAYVVPDADEKDNNNGRVHSGDIAPDIRDNVSYVTNLDVTQYVSELVDFDLSEEQKIEYLSMICAMMQSFVEMNIPAELWKPVIDAVICDPESLEGSNNPPAPCDQ